MSSQHSLYRTACSCIEFFRDSSRLICQPSRNNSIFHCLCHCNRVFSACNASVNEDSIAAEFHRNGRIGCSSNTSINNNRNIDGVKDNFYVIGIPYSKTRANRCTEGHHCSSTSINKPLCCNRVVVAIRKDNKTLLCKNLCCLQQPANIREKRLFVPNHLKLNKIR